MKVWKGKLKLCERWDPGIEDTVKQKNHKSFSCFLWATSPVHSCSWAFTKDWSPVGEVFSFPEETFFAKFRNSCVSGKVRILLADRGERPASELIQQWSPGRMGLVRIKLRNKAWHMIIFHVPGNQALEGYVHCDQDLMREVYKEIVLKHKLQKSTARRFKTSNLNCPGEKVGLHSKVSIECFGLRLTPS